MRAIRGLLSWRGGSPERNEKMKKVMIAAVAAAAAMLSAFADETEAKEKKKMPSTAKYFTSIVQAKKEAAKYDAPIFVAVVPKGTPIEAGMKKVLSNKFFRELATKGFFVYTMRVELSKKEKEADAKTPKVMYEKLSADDKALLDVIAPPDKVLVRKLPIFGMVTPDCSAAKIKVVDMPKIAPSPEAGAYIGPYLQQLQSAAQAYGIDIDMSKHEKLPLKIPLISLKPYALNTCQWPRVQRIRCRQDWEKVVGCSS